MMGIIEKTVSNLHDYVNSEEFSRLVLHQEPRLATYYKVQIDEQIHNPMEKATIKWLNENVPLIIKSEFDTILQSSTKYEKMSDLLKSFNGITEKNIGRLSDLQQTVVSWTILGGSSLLVGVLLGPQTAFLASPWAISALSLSVAAITMQLSSVEEISKDSFEKRVKLISREQLHTFMHQKLEKHLRAFHRHIFFRHVSN